MCVVIWLSSSNVTIQFAFNVTVEHEVNAAHFSSSKCAHHRTTNMIPSTYLPTIEYRPPASWPVGPQNDD